MTALLTQFLGTLLKKNEGGSMFEVVRTMRNIVSRLFHQFVMPVFNSFISNVLLFQWFATTRLRCGTMRRLPLFSSRNTQRVRVSTVGGIATPVARKTALHVPRNSLRRRNRFC